MGFFSVLGGAGAVPQAHARAGQYRPGLHGRLGSMGPALGALALAVMVQYCELGRVGYGAVD